MAAMAKKTPDLSEGQKACLRMVAMHKTSKEIARELGISPFTVDQRLDAARVKLRVATRKEAALKFVEMEHGGLSERLVYEQPHLGTASNPAHPELPTSDRGYANTAGGQDAFGGHGSQSGVPGKGRKSIGSVFGVPPIGGARHSLGRRQILLQTLNVALYSTIMVGIVTLVLVGIMRLLG